MRNTLLKVLANAETFIRSANDESGQDLIEYALLGALISVAAIAVMTPLADKISTTFTVITTAI